MSSGTPTPIQGGPSSSLKGWSHFTMALASTVPTKLRRAQLYRQASLRELARIR